MDYFETLDRWAVVKESIRQLQAEERALREGIFNGTFPEPTEGVNKVELPDGRVLKGTYRINRRVLEDRLTSVPKDIREKAFKLRHSLNTGAYRDLTDAQRAKVDEALDIKPGLPSLDIIEPPEEKASNATWSPK